MCDCEVVGSKDHLPIFPTTPTTYLVPPRSVSRTFRPSLFLVTGCCRNTQQPRPAGHRRFKPSQLFSVSSLSPFLLWKREVIFLLSPASVSKDFLFSRSLSLPGLISAWLLKKSDQWVSSGVWLCRMVFFSILSFVLIRIRTIAASITTTFLLYHRTDLGKPEW